MKKIISLVAAVTLLGSGAVMPAHAAGLEDYVPGQKNANLIPDASAGGGWTYFNSRNCSPVGNANGTADDVSMTNMKYYTSDTVSTENWRTFGGFELNSTQLGDNRYFSPKAGKTYVLKMSLKDVSESGVPSYIGASMTYSYNPSNLVYTNEYGAAGMLVGSDWTEFKGSLTLPSTFDPSKAPGDLISIGYPIGTAAGAAVLLDVSGKDSVYLAEEQAYDVKITKDTDGNEVPKGSSANFKAQVLNQIGTEGALKQNFIWNVFEEDRETIASGFEITTDATTQNTTVKALDSAEVGTYYVLAFASDYTMVRTFKIVVSEPNPFVEYTAPAKNANLIPDASAGGGYTYFNHRDCPQVYNSSNTKPSPVDGTVELYTGTDAVAGDNWRRFQGLELNSAQLGTNRYFSPEAGKTYVLKMSLKDVPESGVQAYFGAAMNDTYAPANIRYTKEYGSTGMLVGTDWTDFVGTITLPDTYNPSQYYGKVISIGFPTGTAAGAAVVFDVSGKDSVYLAEEQLYDITLKIKDAPEAIRAGDTITLDAAVVNQVGAKSSFKQNFKWFAADADKTEKVDGFTFVSGMNGVELKIDDAVKPGTYYIYTESTDYSGMRRALKIDVLKALITDKENVSGNEADAKKVVITSNSDDDIVEMTDEYKLSAMVVNQADEAAELVQEFNWYIIKSDQVTVAENISAEKLDDANIKVSVGIYAEPGVYYAVCEPVKYAGIRKTYKFTVDKPTATEAAVELINSKEATVLKDNLSEYLEVLGFEGEYLDNADISELAGLIANEAKTEAFTADNIKTRVSKLIIVSLYNSNPNNVSLYDDNGDFTYRTLIGFDGACDGTTLVDVFDKLMSTDGRKKLQKALMNKDYESTDEFMSALFEQIILVAIEKPAVLGTEYIESILTKENAEKAKITIDKYTSLKNKGTANSTLARNTYTKDTLEEAIKNLSSGGSGGSSGSSSKKDSSYAVPSSTILQNSQILPDTKADEYGGFDDVGESHWAYDEIYHLKQLGVVSGVDENNFKPENSVTREAFVKMFIDAFGYEKTNHELAYEDIVDGAWYVTYLSTAYDNGLINGVSETQFGIGMPITRQDICVIVARALAIGGEEESESAITDYDEISDYAKASVSYLINIGVINGFEDGSFKPMNYCTRAQAAKIICTLINLGGITE